MIPRAILLLLSLLTLAASPVQAQLRLPSPPQLPALPQLTVQQPPRPWLGEQLLQPLQDTRRRLADELLRRHPRELAQDPAGELIVRAQLLALPSGAAARAQLATLPLTRVEEVPLAGLALAWLRLQAEPGQDLAPLLQRLRRLDPEGLYDYQHLYLPAAADAALPAPGREGRPAAGSGAIRIGLIDGGVDATHPALQPARLLRHGCQGQALPSPHGTAVASLLLRSQPAPPGGSTLYAADVYCGAAPTGGSAQALAQALDWLVRERVPVVNISVVGPPNALLQRVVAALVTRGHLLVAAVGNDGPAAAPLYPAAWLGVVGVTGVDGRQRVLAEAGRGPQVMFAAAGADLQAADSSGSKAWVAVRGTSFAAPLVAALLASQLGEPDPAQAGAALARLARAAQDLGAPGRDDVYGLGLVGPAPALQQSPSPR